MVCMYFFLPKSSDLFWEVDGGHTGRTVSLGHTGNCAVLPTPQDNTCLLPIPPSASSDSIDTY